MIWPPLKNRPLLQSSLKSPVLKSSLKSSFLKSPVLKSKRTDKSVTYLAALGVLLPTAVLVPALAPAVLAQSPTTAAPTVRYARGEDVDLADIVAEWRGYYEDVPVYLCVCQEDTCNQTAEWPFREYLQYEMSVALGPNNGQRSEAAGSTCFDIADGSRPEAPREFVIAEESNGSAPAPVTPPRDATNGVDNANASADNADELPPQPGSSDSTAVVRPPVQPPVQSPASSPPTAQSPAQGGVGIPQAIAINNGTAIQLTWPNGASNAVDVANSNWNINLLDATDCDTLSQVDQKTYAATRVVGEPAVDARTGNVAVPVLLSTCVEVDQSAIFILDPNEGGGYSLYRSQLVGDRALPNEFSSYAFSTIQDVRYWDGALYIRQNDASSAQSLIVFRPGQTPAGTYAGCLVLNEGEGANSLCP